MALDVAGILLTPFDLLAVSITVFKSGFLLVMNRILNENKNQK